MHVLYTSSYSIKNCKVSFTNVQGCHQVAKAVSVPPTAILGGLLILSSFFLSPSLVMVPGTDWVEPALIWLTISMPTGSRKTTVYQFLMDIIKSVRSQVCKGECVCMMWS